MKTASYFTYTGRGRIGISVGAPRGCGKGFGAIFPRRDDRAGCYRSRQGSRSLRERLRVWRCGPGLDCLSSSPCELRKGFSSCTPRTATLPASW